MAQDAELDRLKVEQDRAFRHKQEAWQAQDDAWKRRSAARDAMNRTHADKQAAYEVQDAAWRDLQRTRDYNGPRIEALNSQQETAFQNMKNAFDRASAAHESRDGASARMYADQGHGYKADAQACVTERRQLVQEIRDARDRHNHTKPAFQKAKNHFDRKRDEHNRAKADHEQEQGDFKRAKAEFDRAKSAFQNRLAAVRSGRQQRKYDRRFIAERAGVPHQYLDDVWVSTEPDGSVNIYFGGVGEPAGLGHGHYSVDPFGHVTYQRDPFDPHGAQNFSDYKERSESSYFDSQYHDDGQAAGLTYGGDRSWETPIHGTDAEGRDVTVSFGRKGTPHEGQTLIADGHLTSDEFYGRNEHGKKPHDHSNPADSRNDGYKDRGKYSG